MALADELKGAAADASAVAKDREIAALKAQLSAAKAKYQLALADLAAADARADALLSIQSEPTIRQWDRLKAKPSRGATAIVALCDWHVEETVDPETCGGLNKYDLGIAEARIKRCGEKVLYLLDFARHVAKIEELVVWLGGDLITGYIHEELMEGNSLSPTEACLFVQDMVVSLLTLFSAKAGVKRILVPTSYGNHGRTTARPRFATGYKNSYEWMTYHQIAGAMRTDNRVAFQIGKGYHNTLAIQGRTVRFHHGDGVHYQGGVGGISIPVNKAIAQWNKSNVSSLDMFGHFHTFLDTWTWVSCGCLIGPNAYSVRIKADYQPPTQTFVVIDRTYGKTLAIPIFTEASSAARMDSGRNQHPSV